MQFLNLTTMKRISYAFLAVIMTFAATCTLVSCKDYEEDLRSEQKATQSILDELKNKVEGANGLIEQLNQMKLDLEKLEQDHQNDLEKLKKEHDQDINDLRQKINDEIAALAQIYATKQELADAIDGLQTKINTINDEIAGLKDADADILRRLGELEGKLCESCECATKIAEFATRISNLESWQTTIISWKEGIDTWKTTIDGKLVTITNDLATAMADATAAKTQAELNKTTLANYYTLIQQNSTDIANLTTDITNLKTELMGLIANNEGAIVIANGEIDKIKVLIDQILGSNNSYAGMTLPQLEQEVKDKTAEIADELDAIRKSIAKLEKLLEEINKLTDRVVGIESYLQHLITDLIIQGTCNPVFGSFAIPTNTNSNILAVYYGENPTKFEFPTARPNYYANPEGLRLTSADVKMLGAKTVIPAGQIVSEAEDNAGKIYVTINPTNVDFSGTNFDLVNSLDEYSGVDLSPMEPSKHKLTFGWTRAGASNGFYETKAYISAANIEKVKARMDLEEIKDAVKDILSPRDGINVSNIVSTVYNNFSDVLDANGLKASWTTEDGSQQSVYSKYAIAATAVKPLSYGFLQDLDVQSFPGFGTMENFLNRMFDRINVEIKDALPTFDLDGYKITKIDKIELTANNEVTASATVEVNFTIPAGAAFNGQEIVITDKNGEEIDRVWIKPNEEYNGTATGTANVKVPITDLLNDIEGDLNSFVDDVNNDLQKLNDLLDELNKINEIGDKLTDGLDTVQKELVDYLDRLNNKLCDIVNSANKALQPILLVKTNDSFARVSEVKKAPTWVNSTEVSLIPTSYTADVVAPAYKRLVGVTNVYNPTDFNVNAQADDADCLAALEAVNNQEVVAEVVDGTRTDVKVTLQKGFVYEFAYTAVDYTGKVAAKKCYIAVK